MRIGQGVDAHRFADPGAHRPLRLGGVEIAESPGLEGHSDADVVLHALADALLGAAGLGDLGVLFGTDDPALAGADSGMLLGEVLLRVRDAGFSPGNADVTVIAERPRMAPHLPAMRRRIAELLELDAGAVSVKATSTDGLGFAGRGEGIACLAVVLLA